MTRSYLPLRNGFSFTSEYDETRKAHEITVYPPEVTFTTALTSEQMLTPGFLDATLNLSIDRIAYSLRTIADEVQA